MTDSQKLEAIQALIDGRFDDAALLQIGDLWSGPDSFKLNVQEIINMPDTGEAYYRLILGFLGQHDEIPNSYSCETFRSVKEATKNFEAEYLNRKKGDGYDEYWNSKPLVIQKITEEIVFDERQIKAKIDLAD